MDITYIGVHRSPLKKAHRVGKSIVVTIDPSIVKTLNIDDATFFSQEPAEGAIMMKIRRLTG